MKKYIESYGKTDLFVDSSTGRHELRRPMMRKNGGELSCEFIPGRQRSLERAMHYVGSSKKERTQIERVRKCRISHCKLQ